MTAALARPATYAPSASIAASDQAVSHGIAFAGTLPWATSPPRTRRRSTSTRRAGAAAALSLAGACGSAAARSRRGRSISTARTTITLVRSEPRSSSTWTLSAVRNGGKPGDGRRHPLEVEHAVPQAGAEVARRDRHAGRLPDRPLGAGEHGAVARRRSAARAARPLPPAAAAAPAPLRRAQRAAAIAGAGAVVPQGLAPRTVLSPSITDNYAASRPPVRAATVTCLVT